MPSSKTISKGIRIKNETAEYFRDKPLNRYVEWLQEMIESGEIEITGDSLVCTHGKTEKSECMKRMNIAGAAYGLTGEELAEKLLDSMDTGAITYEGGEFRAYAEENLERLKEACHDKGVHIQKVIDTMTQMVMRS